MHHEHRRAVNVNGIAKKITSYITMFPYLWVNDLRINMIHIYVCNSIRISHLSVVINTNVDC